jgi:hypothetical protein
MKVVLILYLISAGGYILCKIFPFFSDIYIVEEVLRVGESVHSMDGESVP